MDGKSIEEYVDMIENQQNDSRKEKSMPHVYSSKNPTHLGVLGWLHQLHV